MTIKAGFMLASVSRQATGRFLSARRLAQTLAEMPDVEVRVYGMEDSDTAADRGAWAPLAPRTFPAWPFGNFRYSPRLLPALLEDHLDLLHAQELWTYPAAAAWRWKARTRRPYLVSLRGMLNPPALRLSRWKKLVARPLYADRCLRGAACLHAVAEAEVQAAREYGLHNPVCVIPNGADLPPAQGVAQASCLPLSCRLDACATAAPPWADAWGRERSVLLFLGRLHPKKGLSELLQAWAALQARRAPNAAEWGLVLAGWDHRGHEAELRAQARALGLGAGVMFAGPLLGAAKDAALRRAAALVLPSQMEALPMAVLEAWAYGRPVVMTPECNLAEGLSRRAALLVQSDAQDLARGLAELFSMSEPQRREMGARGRALVAERFTWQPLAAQMRAVYEWVLGGGAPPDCVRTA